MRLTTMTDYALRLLMHLAQHPTQRCTIAEVAQAHSISEAHLTKVTHQLGRLGWISTVRGRGGGIVLARPAADIAVGAVVRSIEPDFALVECFATGSQCTLTGRCRLTGVMHGALEQFINHLDRFTLADLQPPADSLTSQPMLPPPAVLPSRRSLKAAESPSAGALAGALAGASGPPSTAPSVPPPATTRPGATRQRRADRRS